MSVPPYLMGQNYGSADIEKFLSSVEALCEQSISPLPDNETISVTNCISLMLSIPKKHDAIVSRVYFHDIEKAIIKLQNWQDNPDTTICDNFYSVFNSFDIVKRFYDWASKTSKYYASRSENKNQQAKEDLKEAILDIQDSTIGSVEESDAWKRGEDAFYYLMQNAFTPSTPEHEWQMLAARGAYLFSIDNRNYNEAIKVSGLAKIRKPPDYKGPLTDKEKERIVIFEGRFPASKASELGFLLDHVKDHLPYGEELNDFFNDAVLHFSNCHRCCDNQYILRA